MNSKKNIRVLVAEDEYLSLMMIKELLETAGYTVIGDAVDGLDVLQKTESLKPDVILMDIEMPQMNGLEAARLIYQRAPTPVVILTAYDSSKLLEEAKDAGVGAYLLKPAKARELERTIEIAIARFEDMMELRRLNERLREEIETRKAIEERLQTTLKEKIVIMKEILHRTKNNMASICAFLTLQSNRIEDERMLKILRDAENYARTMAIVQEKLYSSADLSRIDLAGYLQDLALLIFRNYPVRMENVNITFDLAPVIVEPDTAINCGLIVNELISNAMKYAFPDDRAGEIHISLKIVTDEGVELIVRDNGMGLPEGFQIDDTDTLGLKLLVAFANALDGTLEIINAKPGMASIIRFKV